MRIVPALMLSVALIGSAPAMSGCAALGWTVSPSNKITATKVMIDLETAFNAAVTAERQAKAQGLLIGDNAVKADGYVNQAYSALLVARAAYHAGTSPNPATVMSAIGSLTALLQQVHQ